MKKVKELVLPVSFVELSEDEMRNIVGGIYVNEGSEKTAK